MRGPRTDGAWDALDALLKDGVALAQPAVLVVAWVRLDVVDIL
jgi:hypothetical protein